MVLGTDILGMSGRYTHLHRFNGLIPQICMTTTHMTLYAMNEEHTYTTSGGVLLLINTHYGHNGNL